MKGRKRIIAVLIVLLLASFLSACTTKPKDDGGKVKLVLWHTLADQHEAALDKIIADFNASQSTYEVVAEQQPYSEFDAKLMQATRNGTGPDFTSMWPTDAVVYMNEGLLVDFAPYINDPEIGIPNFKENISKGLYDEITQWGEDQVYLFPLSGGGEVLFYNKTLFDELGLAAPKTWTDVENYSKEIFEAKGIPGFGTDSITDTFFCWIMQAGSDYIDAENAVINMNKDIAMAKLDWFGNGVKDGYFRLVGEDFYFSNPFGSQAVGSYIGSSAGVSYVFAAVGDAFEVGCVPVPQEGPAKFVNAWGSGYACYSKDEVKARGVYEFMKYYASEDVLLYWCEEFGTVPHYLDLLETARFKTFAETNIAIKALSQDREITGALPSISGTATVRRFVDQMVQNVALGTMDASAAFDAFVVDANNEMKK